MVSGEHPQFTFSRNQFDDEIFDKDNLALTKDIKGVQRNEFIAGFNKEIPEPF